MLINLDSLGPRDEHGAVHPATPTVLACESCLISSGGKNPLGSSVCQTLVEVIAEALKASNRCGVQVRRHKNRVALDGELS